MLSVLWLELLEVIGFRCEDIFEPYHQTSISKLRCLVDVMKSLPQGYFVHRYFTPKIGRKIRLRYSRVLIK